MKDTEDTDWKSQVEGAGVSRVKDLVDVKV